MWEIKITSGVKQEIQTLDMCPACSLQKTNLDFHATNEMNRTISGGGLLDFYNHQLYYLIISYQQRSN